MITICEDRRSDCAHSHPERRYLSDPSLHYWSEDTFDANLLVDKQAFNLHLKSTAFFKDIIV